MPGYKLGKKPPKYDPRTLRMGDYIRPEIASIAPPSIRWDSPDILWDALGNNELSDCTIAGACHLEQVWAEGTGRAYLPSMDGVIQAYSGLTGYDPATGHPDEGACLLDLLNYWKDVGIDGRKIAGFVKVNIFRPEQMRLACYWFGGLYCGVMLSAANVRQAKLKEPWQSSTEDAGPGAYELLGGHAIPITGYNQPWHDRLDCYSAISWGERHLLTPNFLSYTGDEAYAVLSENWLDKLGIAPNGFDYKALTDDLALLSSGS